MAALEGINSDGLMDLVVHVTTGALQLSAGDTEAVVGGRIFDGTFFRGSRWHPNRALAYSSC